MLAQVDTLRSALEGFVSKDAVEDITAEKTPRPRWSKEAQAISPGSSTTAANATQSAGMTPDRVACPTGSVADAADGVAIVSLSDNATIALGIVNNSAQPASRRNPG